MVIKIAEKTLKKTTMKMKKRILFKESSEVFAGNIEPGEQQVLTKQERNSVTSDGYRDSLYIILTETRK